MSCSLGPETAATDVDADASDMVDRGVSERQRESDEEPHRLPFGPYSGCTVDDVAVMDPGYLLGLVREGVGHERLRAASARALARRQLLVDGAPEGLRLRENESSPNRYPLLTRLLNRPAAKALLFGVAIAGVLAVHELAGSRAAVAPSFQAAGSTLWVENGVPVDGGLQANSASSAGAGSTPSQRPPASLPESGGDAPYHGAGGTPPSASRECGSRIPGAITAAAAADHVGRFEAVEFEVVRTKDTGRVTFLNSHDPYQGHFYVAIFPGDYKEFPRPPAELFDGRCIVVQGPIELYRGAPQIVLRSAADVRILDE